MIEALSLFDPARHGGEFPTAADIALEVPIELPVQERTAFTSPIDRHRRLTPDQRFSGRGVQIFFAPLIGSIQGVRREYFRLARLGRARRRRQAEFVKRGKAAIERSIAAGADVPAHAVIARLRAKVDAARKRRIIGMLSGKLDVPADFDDPPPEEVIQDFEGCMTTDAALTVTEHAKDDSDFAEALLGEAIELAAKGEPELAKRVVRELMAWAKR